MENTETDQKQIQTKLYVLTMLSIKTVYSKRHQRKFFNKRNELVTQCAYYPREYFYFDFKRIILVFYSI